MALLGAQKRIDLRLLNRDLQLLPDRIKNLDDAIHLHPGMVFIPQIRNGGIAHFTLRHVNIMSIAFYQTPPGTNREDLTAHPCTNAMQILTMRKKVSLRAARQPTGSDRKAALPVYLDDNEVNGCADHVLEHKVWPLPPLRPHFRGGDHNADPVRHHDGTNPSVPDLP